MSTNKITLEKETYDRLVACEIIVDDIISRRNYYDGADTPYFLVNHALVLALFRSELAPLIAQDDHARKKSKEKEEG